MRFLTVAILAICAFGPAFAVDDGVPPIPIIVGLGPSASGGGGGGNAATLEGKTWEAPGTIGSTTPNTGAFTTLTVGSAKFSVDVNGNIIKLNNVTTSFPSVQGAAGTFLSNDGAGNLTWMAGAAPTNNFNALTSGTNTTAAMVVGTGASLATSGSGTIAATTAATAAAAPFSGLTASTNSTAALVVGTGASLATSGSGTIAATSAPFSGVSSGTNTTATMHVGTGASLDATGSGTIAATTATTATTAGAVPFSGVTSSTNTTGALVVGTGGSLATSGSGTINATALNGATFAAPGTIGGGTPGAATFTAVTDNSLTSDAFLYSGTGGLLTTAGAPTDGQVLIGSTGAAPVRASLTAGSNVTITPGAGSITIAAAGSATPAFSSITSGVNTGAAMVLGTGSSLTVSGSGTNNATTLNGATFAAPGAIGGTTPGSVAATTISATGQITSTLATGTAPLVVASTTNVANLNASSLSGATFAAPGPIGSGTPSTGAFTTLSAGSGKFTVDANGNVTKLNNVTQSWPAANAAGDLVNDGSGNLSWTSTPAITLPWSSLTAPTGNLSLAMGANTTAFTYNTATTGNQWAMSSSSLTTGDLVNLASTSAAAASNTQTVLGVATSGANSNSAQTTYGTDVANTHTGTSSTNVGLRTAASGGTNNYGLIVSSGDVGVGTSTPVATLENAGAGAASKSGSLVSGAWFTGGSATTTKPQLLIEPTGTTSTAWSTAGTGLGVNATTGATGDLINLQTNGTVHFSQTATGKTSINSTNQFHTLTVDSSTAFTTPFANDASTALCLTNTNATVNNWTGISFGGTNGTGANAVQAGIYSQISNHTVGSRANNLVFYTATTGASTERMRIGETGLVGIGTVANAVAGVEDKINGAASQAGLLASGTWFTGGSSTTTKPHVLIEPTGTTTNNWSTNGTGLGINAPNAFSGQLINVQVNGLQKFQLNNNGDPTFTHSSALMTAIFKSNTGGATGGALIIPTCDTGAALGSGVRLGGVVFAGSTTGSINTNSNSIESFSEAAWSATSAPSYIAFKAAPSGSVTEAEVARISSAGFLGLNTAATPVAGFENKINGAVSQPSQLIDGTTFSGGSATTTKPQFLIEPSGTASTGWSTAGTLAGINGAAGFTGNLIDAQVAGVSAFKVDSTGANTTTGTISLTGAAGTQRALKYQTAGSDRWNVRAGNAAESGGNAGSSYIIQSFDDSGVAIDFPLVILRPAGSTMTTVRPLVDSAAGAASIPAGLWTGAWFTGGSATTTKPQFLIEPTGTTSTAWSTSGTGLGVNADAAFTGNLIDVQLGASQRLGITAAGNPSFTNATAALLARFISNTAGATGGALMAATLDTGAALSSGDRLGGVAGRGSTAAGVQSNAAAMIMFAESAWSSSSSPTYIDFETAPSGSLTRTERMRISSAGLVGIGTAGAPLAGLENKLAGAASQPGTLVSGTWFTGGSSTTTKPQTLIEPTSTTSTGWSTNGTGLGVNAPAGFTGNLLDLQVNGVSQFAISATGTFSGALPWNSLAAPTGNLSLAMAARTTNFAWDTATTGNQWVLSSNSLSSGVLSTVNCTSTAALGNTQQAFRVSQTGANANSTQTTYAATFQNTKTGTASVDVAALFNATNGDTNYGVIVQAGDVGFQTNTPVATFENAAVGQLSKPGQLNSGTWITGGTATTCKPYTLIQVTGATSNNWSTSGTGFGINGPTSFAGNLIDAQVDGSAKFKVTAAGNVTSAGTHAFSTVGTGNVYKSGTGAYAGNATLVGGTVTVTCATIGTNSVVSLTRKTSGGTIGTAITYTISNGASFTINSDNILDTSTFSYVVSDTN